MLLREKKLIIAVIIGFLLLGLVFHLASGRDSYSSTTVLLKFENIQKGMYPDTTAFDKNDLIDETVLAGALRGEEGNTAGLTVSDIFPYLEVEAVIPERFRQPSGEPVDTFYPTEYRINLYQGMSLGLSEQEQFELLGAIVEEYEKQYQVHLGMEYPLPDSYINKSSEVMAHDYPFVPQLLRRQVETLSEYVVSLQEKDRTFYSEEQGYTFGDLLYALERLEETKIMNLRSLIREYNLSDNPEATLRRYQNIVQQMQPEIAKNEEKALYARDILRELEGKDLDLEKPEEFERSIIEDLLRHDYYPDLLWSSLEAGVEAERMKVDLAYYQDIMSELEQGNVPEGSELQSLKEQANEEIEEIMVSLDGYQNVAEKMRQELFSEALQESVEIREPPRERGTGRGFVFNIAVFGLMGLFAGFGAALLKSNWQIITNNFSKDKEANSNE